MSRAPLSHRLVVDLQLAFLLVALIVLVVVVLVVGLSVLLMGAVYWGLVGLWRVVGVERLALAVALILVVVIEWWMPI